MAGKLKKKPNTGDPANGESKRIDPYRVIGDFFSAATPEHYRNYISSMLNAAYSEDYWKSSAPGRLLYFQEQMLGLIEATHLFVKSGKGRIKIEKKALVDDSVFDNGMEPSSYQAFHSENAIWEFFPRHLTKQEFLNPFKVYERFFEYKNLQTWQKEFRELIAFALEPFGNETAIDYDYLEIHQQLQKFVEASHLIHVRLSKSGQPDKMPKA